mmetsp:Transcript_23585/g.44974  ORF Transcript_23585/g.44974 Transcript_23585/m.44974 type:complete len:175 (-) Transcript_23585:264-788(-)
MVTPKSTAKAKSPASKQASAKGKTPKKEVTPGKTVKDEDVKVKKVYDMPGQKRDPPMEGDSLRKFYTSLREQRPDSEMAEQYLMDHGLLTKEEAELAVKRAAKRKAKAADKAKSGTPSSAAKSKSPSSAKKPAAKASSTKNLVKKPAGKRSASTAGDDDSFQDTKPKKKVKASN